MTICGLSGADYGVSTIDGNVNGVLIVTEVLSDTNSQSSCSVNDSWHTPHATQMRHRDIQTAVLSDSTGLLSTCKPPSPNTGQYYLVGDDGGKLPRIRTRKIPAQRMLEDPLWQVSSRS